MRSNPAPRRIELSITGIALTILLGAEVTPKRDFHFQQYKLDSGLLQAALEYQIG
jgi:hypothetical protein